MFFLVEAYSSHGAVRLLQQGAGPGGHTGQVFAAWDTFMAYLLQFGFDTDGPTEVKIGYTELICNDFELLVILNIIRRFTEAPNL
jgi:hypothetical protein